MEYRELTAYMNSLLGSLVYASNYMGIDTQLLSRIAGNEMNTLFKDVTELIGGIENVGNSFSEVLSEFGKKVVERNISSEFKVIEEKDTEITFTVKDCIFSMTRQKLRESNIPFCFFLTHLSGVIEDKTGKILTIKSQEYDLNSNTCTIRASKE